MTNSSRIIITPEVRKTRTRCEGCLYFRGLFAHLFGFGRAHCAHEGKIIERSYWWVGSAAFNHATQESGFLLPHWCPLPPESEGVL